MGIKISQLKKTFQTKEIKRNVIRDLSLEIQAGDFVSIIGPSGCGKSTILRLIAGLEEKTSGELSLSDSNARMSFVFQDANLMAWRTVYENVALPFELDESLKSITDKDALILETLKKVGLDHVVEAFPHQLSGGMKMRVSLARALVSRPQLLLMDEPFSALDEPTRFKMQEQLRELYLKENMTVIFVTHSVFEAAFLSNRVIALNGPGEATDIRLDESLAELPKVRPDSLRTSPELNKIAERLRVHGVQS